MGAVFAIQVKTGQEIKASEMLKHVIVNSGNTLIKKISALETHTEFISEKTNKVNPTAKITKADIQSHLNLERLRDGLNNLRQQYEAIKRYNTIEYEQVKSTYREKMNELTKKIKLVRENTKRISSVMQGYLLIELHWNSEYMPNELWQLIKSVPLVQNIPSKLPIPQEEINTFYTCLEQEMLPNVEITFEKELDFETEQTLENELLYEANQKEISKEKQNEILDQIDQMKLRLVAKVKEIIQNKSTMTCKIKAFIKRKREMVSMPLSYFEQLYTNQELEFIGSIINAKDFLYRLNNITNREVVF